MAKALRRNLLYEKNLKGLSREKRKNTTPAERKIWQEILRDYKYRMTRQKPIGDYIVDFYCAKLKLVIEIDGGGHYMPEGAEQDTKRTRSLESLGLKVLRFSNTDVLQNINGVCEILNSIGTSGGKQNPLCPPLLKGE